MADHNKPARHGIDPALVAREIPQGAVAIGESHLHESSEVELRPIVTTTAAILAIVVVSMAIIAVIYYFLLARHEQNSRIETPLQLIKPEVAGPKLQVDEASGLGHHGTESVATAEGFKAVEPGRYAAIPVDEAMKRVAAKGALPTGPEWTLRPGEQMVGGVIMNPEQVRYANTPPSEAYVESPGGGAPAATPAAAPGATPPAGQPANTNAQPAARPATAGPR
jgi:hypothetical protein